MAEGNDVERRPVPATVVAPEYYAQPYYYEDEIDLRSYVNVLLRYWWIVVGVPLLAIIVAGIYGFAMVKPGYQATALVAITSPRYIVQFAPEFETVPLNQRQVPLRAYPMLATSADLLQRVLPQVSDRLPQEMRSLSSLRGMVSAKSGSDASIIELSVSGGDPELIAYVANAWADEFAVMVEEVYGQSADEIAAFEQQLDQAAERRDAAEQAMIDFQSHNATAVLEAKIQDQKNALASYLGTQRAIERVVQDATNLRERLALQSGGNKASFADELSALMLEVNSLSSGVSLQLQIQGGDALSDKTVSEQMAFLDNLVTTLADKKEELVASASEIQPELQALQQQLEMARTEEARLADERGIARDLYHSLSLKLEEARLARETDGREVQVAARAVPPAYPNSPRRMMMLGIAGVLGFMIGVFAAFTINFFRTAPKK